MQSALPDAPNSALETGSSGVDQTIELRPETSLARGDYVWPEWGVAVYGGAGVALVSAYLVWRNWPRRATKRYDRATKR
jgi:hypothetical protein